MTNKFFTKAVYTAFLLLTFVICNVAIAQERIKRSINTGWQFYKGDIAGYPEKESQKFDWESISIPHTWNARDVNDDEKGYYRGIGWYKKTLYIPSAWKGKLVSLYFEGASQEVSVYINGKLAGTHIGGYTAFSIPVSSLLKFNGDGNTANQLIVKVSNAYNENIAPLSADFTFYGCIYRDVYLLTTNPVHFDTDNDASSGVFISTPEVSALTATVNIKGAFDNASAVKRDVKVNTQIYDRDGILIASSENWLIAKAGQKVAFNQLIKNIGKSKLWSPDDPYLYRVVNQLKDAKTGKTLDEVSNPLGFRWFSFSADNGFYLNGKPLKLIGTNRHQDFKDMGNALPDAMHVRDMELLKAMGGNFIRISHYPQDPAVVEACDRLGILATEEIPIVNEITESEAFSNNCKTMQREMIRQNYNHPSIIVWAYMNEITLRPHFGKDPEKQTAYFKSIATLAQELETLTRTEDPNRYTMMSCHGNYATYNKAGLLVIPKIIGWNLYNGWYSPNLNGFADFLDKFHKDMPDKPFIISEYGADADPRIHSTDPERFDKSMEYTNLYHQVYLKAIQARTFVSGGTVWNLADFNSEQREETMPHFNNKGLLTTDRQVKDAYLFYQANLLGTPFVKIGSRGWTLRSGIATSDKLQCVERVEVYTNQPEVKLLLNGNVIGTKTAEDHVCKFDVPFVNGINKLEAFAGTYKDNVDIEFLMMPANLKSTALPFNEINVSVGDRRIYIDQQKHQVWLPEKEYQPGSWGYTGGRVYVMKGNGRQSFGSDKNVTGTDDDPIYQTQRVGLDAFSFDVPDGEYEVTLHFAELETPVKQEGLAYNLGSNAESTNFSSRSFNVSVNGNEVIQDLNNLDDLKPLVAYATKLRVSVKNNHGIHIGFKGIKGEAILNGIQVKRIL